MSSAEARAMLSRCEPPRRTVPNPLADALAEAFRGPLRGYASSLIVEMGLGRRFSYIVTEEGLLGIAYAPQEEPIPSWLLDSGARLGDLAAYAWSHPLLTSLALAAVNAATAGVLDRDPGLVEMGGDLLAALNGLEGSRIALIGYVPGVAAALAERAESLTIYEDNPMHRREAEKQGHTVLPGDQLLVDAGQAGYTVMVATGASLLDPRVLIAAEKAKPRILALVGPTSSFHPAIARRLGVHVLGGSYIPPQNRATLLRLVKAGYGFRAVKKLVVKWVWSSRG